MALAGLPAGLVAGTDPDAAELTRARERLAARPAAERARVALVRQEPFRLPLRDGSFDLVVLWQVLEHVLGPDAKQRLLAECLRVLRPGGHLLVETPNQWFPVDYHDNKLPFAHWTGSPRLREWLTWRVRGMRYAPSEYVSLPGLERLLRRAAPGARCARATRALLRRRLRRGVARAGRHPGGAQARRLRRARPGARAAGVVRRQRRPAAAVAARGVAGGEAALSPGAGAAAAAPGRLSYSAAPARRP